MSEILPELSLPEEQEEVKSQNKPALVNIMTIVLFGYGALFVFQLVMFEKLRFAAEINGLNPNLWLISIVFLFALSIASAIGFWLGKKWGWFLAALFFIIQIIQQINAIFSLGSVSGNLSYFQNPFFQIIFILPTIFFLFKSSVLKYFKLDRFPKWKSILFLLLSIIVVYGVFITFSLLTRNGDAYVQLALADYEKGDLIQAAIKFEKALEKGLDNFPVENIHLNLGKIYADLGVANKSVSNYTIVLEINPENSVAWNSLCFLYGYLGEYDTAEDCCNQALSINPQDATALSNLGLLYLNQGEFQISIQLFEYSLTFDSELPFTHAHLALAYAINQQFDEAELSLERARELEYEDLQTVEQLIADIKNGK